MDSLEEEILTNSNSEQVLLISNVSETSKTFSKKEKFITTAVMMYTHFAFVSGKLIN